MSTTRLRWVALTAALGGVCLAGGAVAQNKQPTPAIPDAYRLTDASFPRFFEALQPPKVEPWKSIPWHVSIVEAAQQAEKEGKPVFMWQADGWPLGCG